MTEPRKSERGAAIAELGLVAPVMLLMLLLVVDLGRGFHAYISVTNGARDAARVAMRDDNDCTFGDLSTIAQKGASPYSVTVSVNENGASCEVSVSHTYVPVLPFVTSAFTLPTIGTIGPLWDGTMTETMVSR